MSLTLTENIDATQETIAVTGTVPDSIRGHFPFTLGSEILTLRTFGTTRPHRNGSLIVNRQEWICSRGQQGSAKAAHDAGTELKSVADAWVAGTDITPADPLASNSGSGGVTVTGSQGGEVTATGIAYPGVVTESSPGVASPQGLVVADTDPGAIGAGNIWIQSGPSVTPYVIVWLRNEDDDGWYMLTPGAIRLQHTSAVDFWDASFTSGLHLADGDTDPVPTQFTYNGYGIYVTGQGVKLTGAGKFLTVGADGIHLGDFAYPGIFTLVVDPTADTGVAAPVATLGLRDNGGTGEAWLKTGAADTAWTRITVP